MMATTPVFNDLYEYPFGEILLLDRSHVAGRD